MIGPFRPFKSLSFTMLFTKWFCGFLLSKSIINIFCKLGQMCKSFFKEVRKALIMGKFILTWDLSSMREFLWLRLYSICQSSTQRKVYAKKCVCYCTECVCIASQVRNSAVLFYRPKITSPLWALKNSIFLHQENKSFFKSLSYTLLSKCHLI